MQGANIKNKTDICIFDNFRSYLKLAFKMLDANKQGNSYPKIGYGQAY